MQCLVGGWGQTHDGESPERAVSVTVALRLSRGRAVIFPEEPGPAAAASLTSAASAGLPSIDCGKRGVRRLRRREDIALRWNPGSY